MGMWGGGLSAAFRVLLLPPGLAEASFSWRWLGGSPEPNGLRSAAASSRGRSAHGFEVPSPIREQIEAELDCASHGFQRRSAGPRVHVIDCFLFRGELDLLEARFHELYHWVDAFAIVEVGAWHEGSQRSSAFADCLSNLECEERLAPFLDKVHFTFLGPLPECEEGDGELCVKVRRGSLAGAFEAAGGLPHDMAIVADADEFPRAASAWALRECEVPEKVHINVDWYYFSAHCRATTAGRGLKAISGRILHERGAEVTWIADAQDSDESDWATLAHGGFRLSFFMTPEEIAEKIQTTGSPAERRLPYTSPLWHLENARSCTFSLAQQHVRAEYVRTGDLRYPRVPWYALARPDRMWRFFAHARHHEDAAEPEAGASAAAASLGDAEIAVCITGQLRSQAVWDDLSAVSRSLARHRPFDVFAAVPVEDCAAAESKLPPGHVACVPDLPLSPEEEHFVRHGPQIDFIEIDHRRAHVLQYRLIGRCGKLLRESEHARGRRYRWVLRKRADVFLRFVPGEGALRERAIFAAYRDKDQHFGGLNDKVWLGPPEMADHIFKFHGYMLEPGNWPALAWLCSLATFGKPMSRYYATALANITGPAEAILQNYLMARGVPVRTHRDLRYDNPFVGEVSSLEPLAGPTGIFNARLNPDNYSNAFPREPYLTPPMLNVIAHDQDFTKPPRKLLVLDYGCGTGFLVKELLVWHLSAIGIDGEAHFWPLVGLFGTRADLTEQIGADSYITSIAGLLSRNNISTARLMGVGDKLPKDFNVNVTPGIADWVVSIDVGSFIPPEHHRQFLINMAQLASHGIIVRWGTGPHGVDMVLLESYYVNLGYSPDHEMERFFALFSGLVGPDRGPVRVFIHHEIAPGGVFGEPPYHPMMQASMEHVLGYSLSLADAFEPNRNTMHFTEGEQAWPEGEVEIVVGILRLWRAYLHPWEAEQVLAPLHLRMRGDLSEGLAWGNVSWEALAIASWDASELLRMHLARNASVLAGIATAEQVAWLTAKREEELAAGSCPSCPVGVAGEARPLFSPHAANGLAAGHALAVALASGAGEPPAEPGEAAAPRPRRRPLGLHRQVFLNRLATRFGAG